MVKKYKNYLGRNLVSDRKPDTLTPEKRSGVMAKIRSRQTKFETVFIELLSQVTSEPFQINVKEIKGKPDIVFAEKNLCLFLDSDFWHGWYYPRWSHKMKNDFWRTKIENNRRRDRNTTQYLRRKGWRVLRIWEHSIRRDPEQSVKVILSMLSEC